MSRFWGGNSSESESDSEVSDISDIEESEEEEDQQEEGIIPFIFISLFYFIHYFFSIFNFSCKKHPKFMNKEKK